VIWRFASAATAEAHEKRVFHKSKAVIAQVKFCVHVCFAAFFDDLFVAGVAFKSAFVFRVEKLFVASAACYVWVYFSTARTSLFAYGSAAVRAFKNQCVTF
jgi:hypothetical protein